jgi:hypothetical protein
MRVNASSHHSSPLMQLPRLRTTALACALALVPCISQAQTPAKAAAPKAPAKSSSAQVVKPPIAFAYIDVATSSSDIPGAGMMGAALQGGQSGSLLGALGGLARGAVGGATGGGNTFGNTQAMGFSMGKFVDVSVTTNKNRALAEAAQAIPATMNLGESLKLVAPIPDKPVPYEPTEDKPVEPTYEKPKGKMSLYWGCGETIRPGQPRTLDVATASIDDYAKFFVMRGSTTRGARAIPGHPAWPNKQDDRKVPDSASLVGQHTFTGNGIPESFKVSLGAPQDLMPNIELMQTKKDGGVGLEWKAIPHARGYFITVMGGKSSGGGSGGSDSGEMVVWTSSELPDFGFGLVDYQSNNNIDKWIGEKVILPASATKCAIPKGIFGDEGAGMLRMIAYGSEAFFAYPPRPTDAKIAWEPDWQTKVRVKSTFSSILGMSGAGNERNQRNEKQPPKEEKKPNPVELLKGLFGR